MFSLIFNSFAAAFILEGVEVQEMEICAKLPYSLAFFANIEEGRFYQKYTRLGIQQFAFYQFAPSPEKYSALVVEMARGSIKYAMKTKEVFHEHGAALPKSGNGQGQA